MPVAFCFSSAMTPPQLLPTVDGITAKTWRSVTMSSSIFVIFDPVGVIFNRAGCLRYACAIPPLNATRASTPTAAVTGCHKSVSIYYRLGLGLANQLGVFVLADLFLTSFFLPLFLPASVSHLRLEMVLTTALALLSCMHFTHGKSSPLRRLIGLESYFFKQPWISQY